MKPIRNSAKALIISDNRVLAIKLQDQDGFWYALPGGGQESGESLLEALQRECLEEINCEVMAGELLFLREYIGKNHEFADHDSDTHQLEFMFACDLADGADVRTGTVPDTGQLDIEWLEIDRLDSYRLYPLALRSVIRAHRDGTMPVYMGDVN